MKRDEARMPKFLTFPATLQATIVSHDLAPRVRPAGVHGLRATLIFSLIFSTVSQAAGSQCEGVAKGNSMHSRLAV